MISRSHVTSGLCALTLIALVSGLALVACAKRESPASSQSPGVLSTEMRDRLSAEQSLARITSRNAQLENLGYTTLSQYLDGFGPGRARWFAFGRPRTVTAANRPAALSVLKSVQTDALNLLGAANRLRDRDLEARAYAIYAGAGAGLKVLSNEARQDDELNKGKLL